MQKSLHNLIAIVGMAGLFPGAADIDVFWQNIINKVDASSDVPPHRWIAAVESMVDRHYQPDKAYSLRNCLISDFEFDPAGFDVDEDLLLSLDPVHHAALHTGKQALADRSLKSLNRERTGVILAAIALPTDSSSIISRKILGSAIETKLFAPRFPDNKAGTAPVITPVQSLAAKVTALPASILARGLGLGAGSYTLDAACASSLYAVKLAADELLSHRADTMLAGGVSRPDCLYTQVGFSQLRALSPSGRCAPFDRSADGLVVGEGAGIMVLRRLTDAVKDGNRILGVIHGIGLSNDMRGNLLAPDSEGQLRAMRNAYAAAGWSPHSVDLIECHGAGTPVGDMTELRSLHNLWGDDNWVQGQCAIGSVKSMIGHLLTAAGAAGMIKTLLAFQHKTLPPSINFASPPPDSPLTNGPFRVQTEAEFWQRRNNRQPFRAGVSAFGFGGINAHLLLQEWGEQSDPDDSYETEAAVVSQKPESSLDKDASEPAKQLPKFEITQSESKISASPIAIVGIETVFGSLPSLRAFQETVFKGLVNIADRPGQRWKACDTIAAQYLGQQHMPGGFIQKLDLNATEFRIPPNEIPDIMPQHLLMLKVAAKAMLDAGLPLRDNRPKMGAFIGIDFDFEATNFHLRWYLEKAVAEWQSVYGLNIEKQERERWLESLKDACGPPLTASRTLGALGGIVASRIAREFGFGGPSFVVSCEEASGLKALEIAARFLQQHETDTALVGAVDMRGDIRNIIVADKIKPFSKSHAIHPFDRSARGSLPGEGAAAIVMKRLDEAIADGNRIYAVIKGFGSASGGGIDEKTPSLSAYKRSLEKSLREAGTSPSTISYIETHGSGDVDEDKLEANSLHEIFEGSPVRPAIGSTKPNIGHTGAVSGLSSLVKTALCLYHRIIPPLPNFTRPKAKIWQHNTFHFPVKPQYWFANRREGRRRALNAAITPDGNCMHVILEEFEDKSIASHAASSAETLFREKQKPLGFSDYGLLVIEGDDDDALLNGLQSMERFLQEETQGRHGADNPIEKIARAWFLRHPLDNRKKYAVSLVADGIPDLHSQIQTAMQTISAGTHQNMTAAGRTCYSPKPQGRMGETAFVFPGSGNHYLGMGRKIGVVWPQILRGMDNAAKRLKDQFLPHCFIPWRVSWKTGWQAKAYEDIGASSLNPIFGQVVHGSLIGNLMALFEVKPSAVISYSLGESAGLFAMGAWPDREEMLKRIETTDLFRTELAGPCNAARRAWHIPENEDVAWRVVAVNQPAEIVREVVKKWPTTRLLIINTPRECVIGGRKQHVEKAIAELACDAIYLNGVVTVHCDALLPVADDYRSLHVFPTRQPEGIRFYSGALGRAYNLNSESAASSILNQALFGFDFTATIRQAYEDGVRTFVEIGPGSSCTRMIDHILADQTHTAVSASVRSEDEELSILKVLAQLISERVPANLNRLYGDNAFPPALLTQYQPPSGDQISLAVGGTMISPKPPAEIAHEPDTVAHEGKTDEKSISAVNHSPHPNHQHPSIQQEPPTADSRPPDTDSPVSDLIEQLNQNVAAASQAHQAFLDLSKEITQSYAKTVALQANLLELGLGTKTRIPSAPQPEASAPKPAFDRDQCLQFARGSVAGVLGPEFAEVDTYAARVRLPDEPLMLVDRILTVQGQKGSLGRGRIVTEHDVLPGAWYLDGGHAPLCISVEAGQADLFLCAYLGIDLKVKGKRTYRLLDATVKFHRELPRPGETIRYEIEIEKFIRQGNTYLFLFQFAGYIGSTPMITMTNGCAGFFTPEEVRDSGGVIFTEDELKPLTGKKPSDWRPLAPMFKEGYDNNGVNALRAGSPAACFGPVFDGIELPEFLRLPGGRLKLIDRIVELDPDGGQFGLGRIRAEADIHPDDWFLTCHFVDDRVMPGTLMYECCVQTLRVFLLRLGWVTDKTDVGYEPVLGVESTLKCRGPVTPETRRVIYEVDIKELGYNPQPYAIADAHMYADGHRIVWFKDMCLQMSNVNRDEIEAFWAKKKNMPEHPVEIQQPVFNREQLIEFATGNPSKAFGAAYQPFDQERFIARLPSPPYLLMDRVVRAEPPPWVLKPDGWIESEYDFTPDAWYIKADRSGSIPISILMEIALQPCGWLAAYMGSALKSANDLRFRNLGGNAVLHREVLADAQKTLTVRSRMTQVSEAGEMIIEHFEFEVLDGNRSVYTGNTYFGFFTNDALAQQEGIRDARQLDYRSVNAEGTVFTPFLFQDDPPLHPDDPERSPHPAMADPAKAIRMIDRILLYEPDGGSRGLGFIRGTKTVNPDEWFFKAHFYQDPVCPGSLGIESFAQLLKFVARKRWPDLENSHRYGLHTGEPHNWTYRGQILGRNKEITVEAVITKVQESPMPTITADGYLKVDELYIYKMENFGIQLVPA